MQLRFFDLEVFPEWWCCTFGDLPDTITDIHHIDESIKDTFITVTSDDKFAREHFVELIKAPDVCAVGYNIKGYDLMISNAIYQGFDPRIIKIVSDWIVVPRKMMFSGSKEIRMLQDFANKRISGTTYLDTFDSSTGSLKDKEAILGLSVRESDVPFDKTDLTDAEKADVISYNKHDVYASMYWYLNTVRPFVITKTLLGKKFNLPERNWYTDTNAGLVCKALGVKRIRPTDADKVTIELPERIKQYCIDNLPKEILNHVLNDKSVLTVKLFHNIVVFADGGIHSVYDLTQYTDKKGDTTICCVESDDEWCLVNVDAESFYPSMMVQFGTLSRAVPNPENFNEVLQERFRIKHKPVKTKEDNDTQLADKLILNTTYGASGAEFVPLYDPYQRTRTCRYGQLFLCALACKISKTLNGAKIIQMNTDGILCYVRRRDIERLHELMAEWTRISGIGMEEDRVDKIWQRDVNNYFMIKEGGKEKTKGAWLNHTTVRPGYIMIAPLTSYVCGEAVCNWLQYGKDIVSYILGCKDLIKFCITTTRGPTYDYCVQRMYNKDGMEYEIPMYKCNRLVATKNPLYGKLYKVKKDEAGAHYTQMPSTPDRCLTLNDDMKTYSFDKIRKELDYEYYLDDCAERMEGHWVRLDGDKEYETTEYQYFI